MGARWPTLTKPTLRTSFCFIGAGAGPTAKAAAAASDSAIVSRVLKDFIVFSRSGLRVNGQ
jgi:hypothetical protein